MTNFHTQRQELVVWLNSTQKTRQLKRYGYLHYLNKERKYAILYVDKDQVEDAIEGLKKVRQVIKVTVSPKATINMDFTVALEGEEDRAKVIKEFEDFIYPPK
ncbi:YlbG family protein [Aerococcus urinae]|uniref:YlbG family protein n=1 Tax=Aerococcus urinae TaxID=1376 RepID=UPI0025501229|nr:YlbG family protein [Aerococcus urinae]MDK7918718.1 YlbG family protein [Aerococcus urinae]